MFGVGESSAEYENDFVSYWHRAPSFPSKLLRGQ